ncbi:MAG TPA: CBS domain-containing protein [Actinomycetes bacterium]|jgi:CBS domain-containing protein|nr:CBS domain-containing protein [Actinomycetes bacterium]
MKVKDVYRPWVVAADADERLTTAAARMQDEQVGSLVVTTGGRFAGIVTERDLLRMVAEGADPEVATVADYMTTEPAPVGLDADLHQVAATMFELGCRHLPVVAAGQVVGMVSIRDLIGSVIRMA